MRLTIPHYFDFGPDRGRIGGELRRPAAWDAARDTGGPFGLPESRAEWEAKAANAVTESRARDVAELARGCEARRVCSYGVGTALLELRLSQLAPELELVCADYAPRTVERLRTLFAGATVVEHDLRTEPPLPGDFHLLHRIDTEFSNEELARILGGFREPVLLVPTVLLDWRALVREALVRVRHPRATRAGWVRSEAAFRSLWAGRFDERVVSVGATRSFLLTPRGGAP
jgi:hypothetical protein